MGHLKSGDVAPGWELYDQHGELRRLSDFRGAPVLQFFYPQ